MAIIHSLLDIDSYKPTMAQVAWKHFRNVPVTYSFKNRTNSIALAEHIKTDDLIREFELAREGSLSISVAANQVIDHQKQRYESQHHFRNVIINVPKTKRHPFHHFNFRMAAFGKPIGCFVFKII